MIKHDAIVTAYEFPPKKTIGNKVIYSVKTESEYNMYEHFMIMIFC